MESRTEKTGTKSLTKRIGLHFASFAAAVTLFYVLFILAQVIRSYLVGGYYDDIVYIPSYEMIYSLIVSVLSAIGWMLVKKTRFKMIELILAYMTLLLLIRFITSFKDFLVTGI